VSELEALGRLLDAEMTGTVRSDWPLARLTTYRLGGPAALYAEPAGPTDLEALCRVMSTLGAGADAVPVLALGRGSNLVVSDDGWPGLVIRLAPARFSWIEPLEERRETWPGDAQGLVAGGATSLPLLANWAARRALSGMEFFVAIPGSVGGAVRMNAGAHGRETADCLMGARLLDLDRLTVDSRANDVLGFAYRTSNLTERHLVFEAAFHLDPAAESEVRTRMESYRRHRAATQPGAVQNAGSVFKNPPGDHAGRLVDAAGLKGFRVGGVAVSDLHANFFVADPGARSQDVFDLVQEVRRRVRDRFGVELVPEIRFAGAFEGRVETNALGGSL
jgi:UDP-N-acetylmuramate dehydrogenase